MNILLMRNGNHALGLKMAARFPELSESDLNKEKKTLKKLRKFN